ncbi:MAG: MATE family efflux transporter [Ramlibacter sp.]|nr:MATE family efflux transporter [Ramlibacter sp.]
MATMSPAATPLPRRFILFLGPLVLTNVLQALSGTFNSVFLGQMLGPQALAAAIAFFPVFMTLFAFVIGLGTGASILVGQAWGAQQTGKVRDIAGTVLLGGALLGVVIALAGWWTVPPLLRWLGTPAEVLPEAIAYAHVMLLAMPVLFLSMLAAALLRGMGDTVTPLGVLIVTCAVSAVLTPLIISGRLGLPPQGTASAAWGTLVATAVALLWLGWRLSRRQHLLAPQALRTRLRWRGDLLRPVARLGVPTGLFFITGSLADVGLMSLVNPHGASSVAAWGAAQHVTSYVQFPAMSIAIASSVFAAQAIGAGHAGQAHEVTRVGLKLNLLLTGGLAVVVAALAPLAMRIFTSDQAVVSLGAQLLHISVWGALLLGVGSVFSGVMRAAGTVRAPMLISLGCLACLQFPVGWAIDRAVGLPGLWFTYLVTYGCGAALQAAYYFGVWRKKPVRKLV